MIMIHIILIIALLILTVARRVYLSMIMNFGYLISLIIGQAVFARFNIQYGKYFLIIFNFIIVTSIIIMFVEAFALDMPKQDRQWVFYVNSPILIDIAFDVFYIVVFVRNVLPLQKEIEESVNVQIV